MYVFGIIIVIFAAFFYKAAEVAKSSGLIWAGLSVIVSLGTMKLGWGLLGNIFGQAVLFFGIGIVSFLLSQLSKEQ